MTPLFSIFLSVLLALSLTLFPVAASSSIQGNVTCASNYTQWYDDLVGENPCANLHQNCVANTRQPGDTCNDQVLLHDTFLKADCCCNSISFALSMLCLNCQHDTLDLQSGTDAAKGTYQIYLQNSTCDPNKNQSLPTNIKSATCSQSIRMQNFLYDLFWNGGDWYYEYTRERAGTEASSAGMNKSALYVLQGCPVSTSIASTAPSPSTTPPISVTTPAGSNNTSTSHVGTGAIAGGAVGGVLGLGILCGAAFFCRRKRIEEERDRYAYMESIADNRTRTGPSIAVSNSQGAHYVVPRLEGTSISPARLTCGSPPTTHESTQEQDHDLALQQDMRGVSQYSAPPAYDFG
ncbi:hypothetical protein CONPUDRAFT_69726 [Coniophora puteana RWD-64-598 SS2]|uniref:Epidermal growth factor receptor-like transmembrane-juxtamembrane segment domain-containing protein n=1 Tax=Coniophora puteana (strain RWD-64-598) TaxID=741705 RepID=A0A5M3MZY1_CONPW|nr:uncharacterized protein CONPUDRAFT_69726 [Coniophora puteana RWD-64-598 SS2]EIW84700.1 hypothetical protein CONPUDRAFT_69726 [Coniophora puteana RWD-64-598 SS2]